MSKKVKGQKLDLASFVGPNNPAMNLPTAPDPSRQRKDVRKPRDDEGRSFDSRDRVEKNRDNGQGWSRNSRGDDFGNQTGDNGGDPWRKASKSKFESEERPERVKLNLLPRSGTVPSNSSEISEPSEDKWSKVFKNDTGRKYSTRDDVDDKAKFSNQSTVFKRVPREEVNSLALPTAPRSVSSGIPTIRPVPAPVVKDTSLIDSKAAKSLQRQEADRKAKELKEQQRQDSLSAALKEKEEAEVCFRSAVDLLSTGLKGSLLLKYYKDNSITTTGSMVLKAILSQNNDLLDPWYQRNEFGELLFFFFQRSVQDQVSALYVIQEFCFSKNFPKIESKGTTRRLIEVYFGYLLSNDLVDLDGFLSWADDNSLRSDESKGRLDAIVQTTNFIQSIRQALIQTEEGSDDDDEVDAPRETVK